ncbi:MAG: DUF1540 domain-containing protein [Clostridia bacterium]|nr:DUF1540 domain-containing protein [Clostridia bacterium]
MSNNQKINCTVHSCKYNERDCNMCNLEQITVKPYPNCDSKKTDESVCGSYKHTN